jgi:uncharacterized protein YdhG (YjbR/CyaY superfamily)
MAAAPTIDDYLARQPPAARRILQRVRTILRKSVPGTEEVISYQIPALCLGGRVMIFFAGWKEHYSVYPATDGLLEAFADELAPYSVSKGTIRFPLDGPIPVHLLAKIAKFRAKETRARNEQAAVRKAAKTTASAKKTTTSAKAR